MALPCVSSPTFRETPAFAPCDRRHFHREEGASLAFALGYVHHTGIGASIASKVYEIFDALEIIDYSRRDIDAALLFSSAEETVTGCGALRYVLGMPRIELGIPAELLAPDGQTLVEEDPLMHHMGGTGGVRIGTPNIGFMAELSLMYVIFEPTVLGEKRSLSGFLIQPAAGLDIRF